MTWTYSDDPATTPKDAVRFMCGDTQAAWPFLSDEEINFLLANRSGSTQRAAWDSCNRIMAKLARDVEYSIGPERVWANKRFDNYKTLMVSLRELYLADVAAPDMGEPTSLDPGFDIGMHDNKGGNG